MQQYWTFGFHQCRWGYQNWSVVQDVVDNFAKNEIPLETIWSMSSSIDIAPPFHVSVLLTWVQMILII